MNEAEIRATIQELNTIEVKGEYNLDTLLAVIRFMRGRANEMRNRRLQDEMRQNGNTPVAEDNRENCQDAEKDIPEGEDRDG